MHTGQNCCSQQGATRHKISIKVVIMLIGDKTPPQMTGARILSRSLFQTVPPPLTHIQVLLANS